MATFVLIHGGGHVGWYWHPVQAELGRRGHDAIAPDLPCDDYLAALDDYADTVIEAIGGRPRAGRCRPVLRRVHCAACRRPGAGRHASAGRRHDPGTNRRHGGGTTPATAKPCVSRPAATAA